MNEQSIQFKVEGLTPAQCAILARSRNYKLYLLNRARLLEGFCPFCAERDTAEKVLNGVYWWAKKSPAPEANAGLHFLVIPRVHVKGIAEMDPEAGAELFSIIKELYRTYDITAAGIFARDGDAVQLAGTVEHLHVHVMVPNGEGRLETPIAKGEGDEEAGRKRAVIYEQLFQGTLRPEDFTPEQARIVDAKRLEGYVPPSA